MDKRDEHSWVALELTHLGEQMLTEGVLARSLFQDLGVESNFPIFTPTISYRKGRRKVTLHLIEGYVFLGALLPEVDYFALERRPYVEQILSTLSGPHRLRTLSVISPHDIQGMQKQLRGLVASDISEGDEVQITDGDYRGLEGIVQGVQGEFAYVLIKLRSLEVVATVPRCFLETDCE